MDITKKSVEELKALAYDQMAMLEQTQANLQAINAEIARKTQEAEEVKDNKK